MTINGEAERESQRAALRRWHLKGDLKDAMKDLAK